MVHKAARGAGIPLGHADDLAAAAGWALVQGDAASEITAALDASHPVWRDGPALIDAVICDTRDIAYANCPTPAVMLGLVATRRAAVSARMEGADVIVSPVAAAPAPPLMGPITVPDTDWDLWNALAAKTYVPASEASRLSGAGAGLTDND